LIGFIKQKFSTTMKNHYTAIINKIPTYITNFLLSIILLAAIHTDSFAQFPIGDTSKNKAKDEKVWPPDSLGRRSPRGTVEGFLNAVAARDYDNAALYLRLDPKLKKKPNRVKLAQALQTLLDAEGNLYPYSWISNQPNGMTDDKLGANLDRVGIATVNGEPFDLLLESTVGPDGGPIWLFSSETIGRIPVDTTKIAEQTFVEKASPEFLEKHYWGGVPIAHWMAMVVIAIVAYAAAFIIIAIIVHIMPLVWKRARNESTAGIIQSFVLPIRLYLAVWLFVVGSREAGISIIVRQRLNDVTVIVGLVAILLLLWQLLDFISTLIEKQMAHHGNHSGISAVLFLRRAAKVALVVLGIIFILSTFGVNVTTWLAALGIGGIALALGTQKTVENFVGSVTLIADHPIRVGDFCKAGDVTGTVEQIGMRTTRIRTGDRTIISIPNGDFSSMKIENFAPRDRFLFDPVLNLRFETTPEQIRYLLVELRAILYAHPKVSPDPARIRFIGMTADALKLEVYAYIDTTSNDEFLEVQEDLLLRFMEVVNASGSGFAFPSQTLYFAKDPGVSKEKATEIEAKVQEWRDAGEIQLPKFSEQRISELRNTIPYPPTGSNPNLAQT
jgi:MscS family membrane protein